MPHSHAALESIDGNTSAEAELLRLEYRQLLDNAESNPDGLTSSELPADPLRRQAIGAARQVLFEMRSSGEIGDDAFQPAGRGIRLGRTERGEIVSAPNLLTVMPGLDPGIHHSFKEMDCRVKPGNDRKNHRPLSSRASVR